MTHSSYSRNPPQWSSITDHKPSVPLHLHQPLMAPEMSMITQPSWAYECPQHHLNSTYLIYSAFGLKNKYQNDALPEKCFVICSAYPGNQISVVKWCLLGAPSPQNTFKMKVLPLMWTTSDSILGSRSSSLDKGIGWYHEKSLPPLSPILGLLCGQHFNAETDVPVVQRPVLVVLQLEMRLHQAAQSMELRS